MYENSGNQKQKDAIKKLIQNDQDDCRTIFEILLQVVPLLKEKKPDDLIFCGCRFPIAIKSKEGSQWLSDILTEEVDFRHWKIYLSCPNCKRELSETQH